ncbi:ATP-grasp domain-containing protein [Brevibacillus sp. NRS-1366]|uniref:ATP-grasp domain-containing protein n=1 Tax=Brevibacillus sp. NRS-1366 TaxID=3233899 RepID=UPI003D2493A3
MNLMLTSVGRRVKVVRYFRQEWKELGHVIAVDCDETAPALYAADAWEQIPRMDDPLYISTLLDLCRRYQIHGILSLIDPELSVLASHADRFREHGVTVILSSSAVIEMCLDKQATHDFLVKNDIPCIPTFSTWQDIQDALATNKISFPLLAKPRKGSASLGIRKVEDEQELEMLFFSQPNLVVQPFVDGVEFGVDVYVDMISAEPVSIFSKKKLRMRSGETDRSIAIKDEQLTDLVRRLLAALPLVGPVDMDCFWTKGGFVISEINPRFGGGYPHAYESGENFMKYVRENLQGRLNCPRIGQYRSGSTLVKFDDHLLLE